MITVLSGNASWCIVRFSQDCFTSGGKGQKFASEGGEDPPAREPRG